MRNFSYGNEFCIQFHFHENQSHFHKNGFTLRLALKHRHNGTRKWSVGGAVVRWLLFEKFEIYKLLSSSVLYSAGGEGYSL